MNLLPIALLVSGACQAPLASLSAAPDGSSVSQSGQAITRVYDLTPLDLISAPNWLGRRVFPILTGEFDDSGVEEFEVDGEFSSSLLRTVLAGDFESDEVVLEEFDERRLIVSAPAAVHQRIATVLAEIDRAISGSAHWEVSILQVPAKSELPVGLLPDEQAAEWLAGAESSGRVERVQLRTPPGLPGRMHQGRELDVLADYDVEVAEGSQTFDPVIYTLDLGTRINLRSAPGDKGSFLALTLVRSTPEGQLRKLKLERGISLQFGDKLLTDSRIMLHEQQAVLGRSLALNAFLPEGQALVARFAQASAEVHELVVVRRIGGQVPVVQRIAGRPGGRAMTVLDVSRWCPPVAYGTLRDMFQEGPEQLQNPQIHMWSAWFGSEPWERDSSGPDVLDWMLEQAGLGYEESLGWWPLRAMDLDADAGDVARRLEAFAPGQRNVLVELKLRRGKESGVVTALSLPLLVGRNSEAVICGEDPLVMDADVEIAKYSSLEDPILRSQLEGLFVSLTPTITPSGVLELRIYGLGVVTDGQRRIIEPADQGTGQLESQGQRYMFLDERLRFEAGTQSLMIGERIRGLALEVNARAL